MSPRRSQPPAARRTRAHSAHALSGNRSRTAAPPGVVVAAAVVCVSVCVGGKSRGRCGVAGERCGAGGARLGAGVVVDDDERPPPRGAPRRVATHGAPGGRDARGGGRRRRGWKLVWVVEGNPPRLHLRAK